MENKVMTEYVTSAEQGYINAMKRGEERAERNAVHEEALSEFNLCLTLAAKTIADMCKKHDLMYTAVAIDENGNTVARIEKYIDERYAFEVLEDAFHDQIGELRGRIEE